MHIPLANLCNSTNFEMCDDMIRVSQRIKGCQMLRFIAESYVGGDYSDLTISIISSISPFNINGAYSSPHPF